jgi:hypothetical protein
MDDIWVRLVDDLVVYQIVELGFVCPGEAVVVAFVLAIVPYLILRGLVNRLVGAAEGARRWSV